MQNQSNVMLTLLWFLISICNGDGVANAPANLCPGHRLFGGLSSVRIPPPHTDLYGIKIDTYQLMRRCNPGASEESGVDHLPGRPKDAALRRLSIRKKGRDS
jgi:hypothetical protein